MNISLKPGPIISIWLPGFALTVFTLVSLQGWNLVGLVGHLQPDKSISFWFVIALMAISFVVGQFLDAVREVALENFVFDNICGKVKWEFFFEGSKKAIDNLEAWFYIWYEMDANMVVAILVAAILGLLKKIPINFLTGVLMTLAAFFFFWGAIQLRSSTKEMIDKYYEKKPPAA
jgi:hypothetical protein